MIGCTQLPAVSGIPRTQPGRSGCWPVAQSPSGRSQDLPIVAADRRRHLSHRARRPLPRGPVPPARASVPARDGLRLRHRPPGLPPLRPGPVPPARAHVPGVQVHTCTTSTYTFMILWNGLNLNMYIHVRVCTVGHVQTQAVTVTRHGMFRFAQSWSESCPAWGARQWSGRIPASGWDVTVTVGTRRPADFRVDHDIGINLNVYRTLSPGDSISKPRYPYNTIMTFLIN